MAIYILIAAVVFGLCFLLDKGFQKAFRNKIQHRSGLSVRLNKSYSIAGVLLSVLGILAIMSGIADGNILIVGIGLCVYHLSFGVFYREDAFLYTSFGKKETTYRYSDILAQKLYVITGGSLIVELHMADGNAVSIQTTMNGAYPFLDAAFAAWCRQKGIDPESCTFHDPENHLWFPQEEV